MRVISLFDGIACGLTALKRAGKKVDKYYASEIDKYAMQIAMKNHPEIIQIGSVEFVNGSNLPEMDLLIGGSPCQSLSNAGNGSGFEGKSGLFYEYLRILRELRQRNPNLLFLLENVKMKSEWRNVITKELGVEPILINSALVSAQKRDRYYWTNIPGVEQPKDKGILLKDVLEKEVDSKYYYSEKAISYLDRNKINKRFSIYSDNEKSVCLTANFSKSIPYNVYVDREKSHCLTQNYANMACVNYNKGQGQIVFHPRQVVQINENKESGGVQPYMQNRVYSENGIAPSLTSFADRLNVFTNNCIRKLTPLECERLQTLPNNYTDGVSDSQRYKMIGNGWTIDVIAHIFKGLPLTKGTDQ